MAPGTAPAPVGGSADDPSNDGRADGPADDRAQAAAAFARGLASTRLERSELQDAVVRQLAETVGDAAVLFVRSADGTRYEVAAAHHRRPGGADLIVEIFREVPHAAGGGLLAPVFEHGETLFMADVPDDLLRSVYDQPEHHRYFDRYGLHSLVIVPLTMHADDLGAIAVARGFGTAAYTSDDLAFVSELADRTALALYVANAFEAERRAAALLRAVVDAAVDAIVVIDDTGTIQSANPATSRLFGYAIEDLLGAHVSMLMPEPHRARHDWYVERYIETREPRIIGVGREVSGLRRDGSLFPLELAVSEVDLPDQRLFAGIMRDISERKRIYADLARLAESDPLTGLANRTKLLRTLDRYVERDGSPATAVVFVDLDGFKAINDQWGHDTGDAVLEAVGQRIAATARGTELVSRYGGDEFAILVPAATSEACAAAAHRVTQRVLTTLDAPIVVHGRTFHISASIGIAVYPDDAGTAQSLVRRADAAMYDVKRQQPGWYLRAGARDAGSRRT